MVPVRSFLGANPPKLYKIVSSFRYCLSLVVVNLAIDIRSGFHARKNLSHSLFPTHLTTSVHTIRKLSLPSKKLEPTNRNSTIRHGFLSEDIIRRKSVKEVLYSPAAMWAYIDPFSEKGLLVMGLRFERRDCVWPTPSDHIQRRSQLANVSLSGRPFVLCISENTEGTSVAS